LFSVTTTGASLPSYMIVKCFKLNFEVEKSHPIMFCLTNFGPL